MTRRSYENMSPDDNPTIDDFVGYPCPHTMCRGGELELIESPNGARLQCSECYSYWETPVMFLKSLKEFSFNPD